MPSLNPELNTSAIWSTRKERHNMPLLTIAIPTFNKASYLEECLKSLKDALPENENDIEILIINNNSSDKTESIINTVSDEITLRYIKNQTNIGSNKNFKKCVTEAKGRFVWIFKDDNIFFKYSIKSILHTLKHNKNIGLLNLKIKSFQKNEDILGFEPNKHQYNLFDSKEKFIKKIHTNITSLSANIFNKTFLKENDIDKIPNNRLGQVYWNMLAVIKTQQSISCDTPTFGDRRSVGDNFCEVFADSFINILNSMNKKHNIARFINIFYARLLIFYYPINIIKFKNKLSNTKQNSNNCFSVLYSKFKFNIYFWIFTVPAIVLPKKAGLYIIKKIKNY